MQCQQVTNRVDIEMSPSAKVVANSSSTSSLGRMVGMITSMKVLIEGSLNTDRDKDKDRDRDRRKNRGNTLLKITTTTMNVITNNHHRNLAATPKTLAVPVSSTAKHSRTTVAE